jgi:EAL domain-containing protein (putative c-di-GMP-specific phosphodiesterase class I)
MLAELDMLMMHNALACAAASGSAVQVVSVNVGLRNAQGAEIARRVQAALIEFGMNSRDLVIEVSESEALADARAVETLAALREVGVSVAVDDFGVGYSNLSRLDALQPHIVKLDRSFVQPLDAADVSTGLIAGVIGLAHELGAMVIAEGVETERQLDTLQRLGCDAVQGFLVGRPSPAPWEVGVVLDVA